MEGVKSIVDAAIEKVAMALQAHQSPTVKWNEIPEVLRLHYLGQAKAAVEAMREMEM